MSIKSTITLTRAQALALREELKQKLYGISRVVTNEELGNELDNLQVLVCKREGRTCFDNYLVHNE